MKAIAKTELIDINTHLGRIRAFSTQRDAADWSSPYSGFNVCHYTADKPAHIAECRRRMAAELNLPVENLIIPRQTHSANIAVVDSMPIDNAALENIDGIVTSQSDIALCINTADCVPVILVDPESGIIGTVHSGWRGTVERISARAVEAMVRLGATPTNIIAAMGPSICPDCFEVGEEVALKFHQEFGHTTVIPRTPRPHVDLPRAITLTLTDAGLQPTNIHLPPACSHCHPNTYFSARRQSPASGRTLTLILRTQTPMP